MSNGNLWVEPSDAIIKKYNDFWRKPIGDEEEIALFESDDSQRVRVKEYGLDFDCILNGEKALENILMRIREEGKNTCLSDTIIAVVLLNEVYSTHLRNPIRVAIKLQGLIKYSHLIEKALEPREEDVIECVDEIAIIDKKEGGAYCYSFATKFCNWINRRKFPVFDRIAAGYLLSVQTDLMGKKEQLGDYKKYLNIYNRMVKENNISPEYDYKHIDIFIWTYGKFLNKWYLEKDEEKKSPQYIGSDIGYIARNSL